MAAVVKGGPGQGGGPGQRGGHGGGHVSRPGDMSGDVSGDVSGPASASRRTSRAPMSRTRASVQWPGAETDLLAESGGEDDDRRFAAVRGEPVARVRSGRSPSPYTS
jgi:hypothetical protein